MTRTLSIGTLALAAIAFGTTASAQTASTGPSRGYAEFVAQSAFGNVTSQNFGGEAGFGVTDDIQVFVEGGRTRDTAPAEIGAEAALVAGQLSQSYTGVSYQVRQPVNFFAGGIRYVLPIESRVLPYVLGGAGVAQVKQDVTFAVNGSDITSSMAQYGTVLGSQLTGSSTRGMLVVGGGVAVPLWQSLVIDLQYRYDRIFTQNVGTNVNRAGVGIGIRF